MADRITLQVARYRPEQESEPTFEEYEVPCRPEWVVLDALNYVKDHQDGTLSYRWSCRMGICGLRFPLSAVRTVTSSASFYSDPKETERVS